MGKLKQPRVDYTMRDLQLLRELYPTTMPLAEIMARIPGHTEWSIKGIANQLGLRRPNINWRKNQTTPGLDRIKKLLGTQRMTMKQIAAALDISVAAVSGTLRRFPSEWYIAEWRLVDDLGHYERVIAVGAGEDAEKPITPQSRCRRRQRAVNPFAVASGAVVAPSGIRGRVIKQDMTIHLDHLDEMEAA